MVQQSFSYYSAMEDFRRERRMAALQQIAALFTGKSAKLLSYSDVSRRLKMEGSAERGLQEIPIDAIVGSVGRDSDFTRSFFPRQDVDIERWARVKAAVMNSPTGFQPIEVYRIGDAYFVRDGHHRVSVARELKLKQIEAYVIEVRTRVPLSPDISPEELILKSEYADFLENTHFDKILPGVDLTVSIPDSYEKLEEHIRVHRYFMGIDEKREISLEEAVRHWYETLYLPVIEAIRNGGVMREFPGRTETDLYLWISDHRYWLEKELGWHIRTDVAAAHLAENQSPRLSRILQRLLFRVIDWLVPDQFEDRLPAHSLIETGHSPQECVFLDLLVPVSGEPEGWSSLDQAFILARCEGGHVNGLHVVPQGHPLEGVEAQAVREQFEERCLQAGIQGSIALAPGEVAHQVNEKASFNDLVVLNLAHPPGEQFLERLGSGLRTIIRRCPRPVLTVPGKTSPMDRLLLAFDGSPKAREALYLSAYMAGKWEAKLTVLTVVEPGKTSTRTLRFAQKYLEERKIKVDFFSRSGPADEIVLQVARECNANLILMGGYGYSPVVEAVLGSTVDRVLREAGCPILICQ